MAVKQKMKLVLAPTCNRFVMMHGPTFERTDGSGGIIVYEVDAKLGESLLSKVDPNNDMPYFLTFNEAKSLIGRWKSQGLGEKFVTETGKEIKLPRRGQKVSVADLPDDSAQQDAADDSSPLDIDTAEGAEI